MSDDIEQLKKHIKLYWMVGGALFVLTVVTVAVALIPFGVVGHMVVGLSIAALKAAMVAAIFMHLNAEKKFIYITLVFAAFFFVGLMGLSIFAWWEELGHALATW
jgi:caa(3)-type oxidase subunit IV